MFRISLFLYPLLIFKENRQKETTTLFEMKHNNKNAKHRVRLFE